MSRRVGSPLKKYPDAYVDLPDEWFGIHAQRRDEAVDAAIKKELNTTLTEFAIALALADDWRIPGLDGNPEAWDFTELPLELIAWVTTTVIADFMKCFEVKKALSSQSLEQ